MGIAFCDIYSGLGTEQDLARLGTVLGYFGRKLSQSREIFHDVLSLLNIASQVFEQHRSVTSPGSDSGGK